MTWLPAPSGLSVELVHPQAAEVDFGEIAHALAHLNRSSGNSATPVSVGLHTLIGLDLCPTAEVAAHWLIHDAHEARLGDVTTPMKEAQAAVALERYGADVAFFLADLRREMERRHDAVIRAEAGLPVPNALILVALKRIDLRALATERRDFYRRGPAPRPWAIDALDPPIKPGPRVWRWLPPDEVALRLLAAFRTHLPALAQGRRAS